MNLLLRKFQVLVSYVVTPCSEVVGYRSFGRLCWPRHLLKSR